MSAGHATEVEIAGVESLCGGNLGEPVIGFAVVELKT
jgi:hypothetical protein